MLGINELDEPAPVALQATNQPAMSSSDTDPGYRRVLELMEGFSLQIRSSVSDGVAQGLAMQNRTGHEAASISAADPIQDPHPNLLKRLREFLSNPDATFKTPEQAEALEVSVNRKEHLLLVGPTAMGKSLVYMLPSALYDEGLTTIVILPLSALHPDMYRRCQKLNMSFSRWAPPPHEPQKTSIVFVSPEHAQMRTFLEYAISLQLSGKLARVVVDEVHLVLQQANFRYCLANLAPLIIAGKSYF